MANNEYINFIDKNEEVVQLIHNNRNFTFEEILKLNNIPLSATILDSKTNSNGTNNAYFLYNTIVGRMKNIKVNKVNLIKKEGTPIYYEKVFIGFEDDGTLTRFIINMDREGFLEYVTDTFKNFIKKEKIVEKGDSLLVGYSGGMDSTVMIKMLTDPEMIEQNFSLSAATISNIGGTHDRNFVKAFCKENNVEHSFIEQDEIMSTFKMRTSLSTTMKTLLGSRYNQHAINLFQRILTRMLQKTAEDKSLNKVALGLERESMINTILALMMTGEPVAGIYKKFDGKSTIVSPMMCLFRKEEVLYQYIKMPYWMEIPKENANDASRYDLYGSEWRGLLMLLAGHIIDEFPGIDMYLENSSEKLLDMIKPKVVFKYCDNCEGSYVYLDSSDSNMCEVCLKLKELNLLTSV